MKRLLILSGLFLGLCSLAWAAGAPLVTTDKPVYSSGNATATITVACPTDETADYVLIQIVPSASPGSYGANYAFPTASGKRSGTLAAALRFVAPAPGSYIVRGKTWKAGVFSPETTTTFVRE